MSVLRTLAGTCAIAGVLTACQHRQASVDDHMSHMSAGDMSAPPAAGGTSQGHAGLPPSATTAQARLEASPRHGEWIRIPWEAGSTDSLEAYIVYPMTNRAKAPVVVVVHEIFGLQTWVRGVADQVAAEGFIAIAPDLNSRVRGGPSTTELTGDSARKLISGVSIPERNRGITASARYAMSQPSAAQKYAVIGFCWGGQTVWGHAMQGGTNGFSGGVAFYGAFPFMNGGQLATDSMAKIRAPVMLLSGSLDARIGASMPAIDSAMKAQGHWYFGKNYEGASHGFARSQDDPRNLPQNATPQQIDAAKAAQAADLAAIKDAWPRTVEFLKKNLGI
ncbi:MAG TPA: dienelactone hydrolase family protein [Gemmatimonadaceae bacterium]|nr:dienelactone hydrolase family protein [Gemmatimonadaceae bacterium]